MFRNYESFVDHMKGHENFDNYVIGYLDKPDYTRPALVEFSQEPIAEGPFDDGYIFYYVAIKLKVIRALKKGESNVPFEPLPKKYYNYGIMDMTE